MTHFNARCEGPVLNVVHSHMHILCRTLGNFSLMVVSSDFETHVTFVYTVCVFGNLRFSEWAGKNHHFHESNMKRLLFLYFVVLSPGDH